MADDALQLLAGADSHDPACHCDGGVPRAAPGRERVGRIGIDYVETGHRDSRRMRQLVYNRVELRLRLRVDFPRTISAEHDLVGEPVAEKVHHRGDNEKDRDATLSAD